MKLFFRKYGNGPPLLILHGLYGSSDNWVSIAKMLESRFTVILPDLRNHGLSPHSEYHDYNALSFDILELVSDMRLGHFFIAGHSMGGKTAIRFTMKWPEMIDGLIVGDISPFAAENRTKIEQLEHSGILNIMLTADLKSVRTRKDAELLFESIKSEKIKGLLLKNLQRNNDNVFTWKINTEALSKNLNRIFEPVLYDDNNDIQISGFPVYFLKAENSDYISSDDFTRILKVFPAAELITIPNAGHWIHVDNPAAVCEAFMKLLNSE